MDKLFASETSAKEALRKYETLLGQQLIAESSLLNPKPSPTVHKSLEDKYLVSFASFSFFAVPDFFSLTVSCFWSTGTILQEDCCYACQRIDIHTCHCWRFCFPLFLILCASHSISTHRSRASLW
jgi:hypothetical protein